MRLYMMFDTAVCVLFLVKLRWLKKKNINDLGLVTQNPISANAGLTF